MHLRLRAAVMDDLAAVLESPCLHWPPEALAAPSPCGSGLRELFDSPLMQVVAPCPSSMVADEEEPGEASPSPAQGPGQVIKKLCFGPDGVGAAVPVDLPPEVVLFHHFSSILFRILPCVLLLCLLCWMLGTLGIHQSCRVFPHPFS